jgi:hypothetical protein
MALRSNSKRACELLNGRVNNAAAYADAVAKAETDGDQKTLKVLIAFGHENGYLLPDGTLADPDNPPSASERMSAEIRAAARGYIRPGLSSGLSADDARRIARDGPVIL